MRAILTKFEAYLLTEKRASHNTVSAYRTDLEQFMQFLEQQSISSFGQVQQEQVSAFLHALKKRHLSARSMSRKISSLKKFYGWLRETLGWHNPMTQIPFPSLEKKLPSYLSEQEIEQLLAVTEQDASDSGIRNKIIVYLLYSTGVRISELVHLTLDQVRGDQGCIMVMGKGGKERLIPMPQSMIMLLQDYIQTVHKRFVENHKQTKYLFPIAYGRVIKPMSRQACWVIIRKLWQQTSIKRTISPHLLRHSLATHMLKNGADLRSLQLLLGHENLATVQVYTHVETSYLRSVYDKKHPRS